MDVRLLETFVTVAELGSMADAAARHRCTGPAISQQMSRLEKDLGVSLLRRSRHGVELTPSGEELLVRARGILGAIVDTRSAIKELSYEGSVPLRLEAFPSAGVYLIPHVLRELRRTRSAVPVSLVELNDMDVFGRVSSGQVDLSIGYEYDFVPISTPSSITVTTLGRDPIDVLLPKRHRLADKRSVSLVDLRDEDWVFFPPDNIATLSAVEGCIQHGFTPRIAFESGDYQVVQALVATGAGISLMPRMVANALPKSGVVVRELHGMKMARNVFVSHRRTYDQKLTASVVDALHDAFGSSIAL
jgi:DNA-binding transcriptional LysR family regulator